MEVYRRSSGLLLLLGLFLLATTLQVVQGEAESEGPSESECRPYIEKALKELETGEPTTGSLETGDSKEDIPTVEITDDSDHQDGEGDNDSNEGQENTESVEENVAIEQPIEPEIFSDNTIGKSKEAASEPESSEVKNIESSEQEITSKEDKSDEIKTTSDSKESEADNLEKSTDEEASQEDTLQDEAGASLEQIGEESNADTPETVVSEIEESEEGGGPIADIEDQEQQDQLPIENVENIQEAEADNGAADSKMEAATAEEQMDEEAPWAVEEAEEEIAQTESEDSNEDADEQTKEDIVTEVGESQEHQEESTEDPEESAEQSEQVEEIPEVAVDDQISNDISEDNEKNGIESDDPKDDNTEEPVQESLENEDLKSEEQDASVGKVNEEEVKDESVEAELKEGIEELGDFLEEDKESREEDVKAVVEEPTHESNGGQSIEDNDEKHSKETTDGDDDADKSTEEKSQEIEGSVPVEDLSLDVEIPADLRSRDHVEQLLKLDDQSKEKENIINQVSEITLKELKRLYENAIKPLEVLYKYRDLSNRHFGDAEIFSKPLVLFMGPWSGGKSSIINYLVNNEYNETSLRTGAEPSPAYFNILMYGEEPEVIDGTELAADFTFSGLQKFGQGLEERLRGVKLPTKLLEKVNIVEIPGILEVRKQVSRVFPFNDACQWFIDRADIIFLVYDPSKLDVGPETEAILDQLKGREHQTRIILNKADQVKPEELMRVQGALIWNISPLMSSPQPPVMYTTSLWSRPYESWAPVRLLHAQERAFLRDLRGAIEKRIENKIACARRFAVRVRNHAKMVDCYLTTYYNHKSVFGNRKQVANEIIENPQDYHIYEGLSTLTNISRYDLPDPDVYRDFFKLNPLYEFQQLSATCTYFRGCPINRLDVAIAYDLPELVGTHKKRVESALAGAATVGGQSTSAPGS